MAKQGTDVTGYLLLRNHVVMAALSVIVPPGHYISSEELFEPTRLYLLAQVVETSGFDDSLKKEKSLIELKLLCHY